MLEKKWLAVCIILIHFLYFGSNRASARTVTQINHPSVYSLYELFEISLSVTAPAVNNPFTQVSTVLTVTTPSGSVIKVNGFCDSNDGSLHRVRFTPRESGQYTYTLKFTDPHGNKSFTGSFTVTSSQANNGFIGTDPEYPDAFMHDNGEHPFIVSKTAWLICGVSENIYRGYIDKMPARKENCIRFGLEFDFSLAEPHIDVWPWQGNRSNPDYTRFDIDFWRKLDRIIKYAAERDIFSEVVVFTGMRTKLDWQYAEFYLDYIMARLAAYPSIIMFQTNNEFNTNKDDKSYLVDIADFIHDNDPYGHLVAPAHRSTTDAAWGNEAWVDVAINHWAKDRRNSLEEIREIALNTGSYNKPAWSDETAREIRHNNNSAVHRRKQYWTWNISGVFWCFHSLEGSEGIVDLSYNGPGYEYEPYFRTFWERTRFWEMDVNTTFIRNDPASLHEWCYASDEEIVIYMVNGPDNVGDAWEIDDNYVNSGNLRVRLPQGTYDLEFYNPSNGSYYTAYGQTGLEGGQIVTVTYPRYNHDLVVYFKADVPIVTSADFSASPLTGFKPHTVRFSDQSQNAWAWEWDFGDGSPASFEQNPSHTYVNEGFYTVTLTATGQGGSDTETKTDYIHVTDKPLDFTDMTTILDAPGYSASGYGRAAVFADVNHDGWTDLWVSNAGGDGATTQDQLYINDGSGFYNDEAAVRQVADPGYTHGLVCADFNTDGQPDVFFANQPYGSDFSAGKNRLYLNSGVGVFNDVTATAGMEDIYGYSRGVVALDVEGDGDQDLFVANWGGRNETYINNGSGVFAPQDRGANGGDADISAKQGVTVSDVDMDGDTDIYVCRRDAANQLYLNNGNGQFTEQASARGCAVSGLSHGAVFCDMDTDGDPDLFVVNYAATGSSTVPGLTVLRNNGNGYFTDISNQYNIEISGYSLAFGDLDNDTDPDMFLLKNAEKDPGALPQVWLNNGAGQFTLLQDIGLDTQGNDARSVALADIDRDGDLDVYITCAKSTNILYRNELTAANHYIDILCEGPLGDYGGFGSRVWVYAPGHLGENNYLLGYQESVSAFGYLGQNQPALHFGLAQYSSCDVRVVLVNGTQLNYSQVAADQVFEVDAYQQLTAPIVLQAHPEQDRKLTLTWTHVSNVSGYNVYRSTTPEFTPDQQAGSNRVATLVDDENTSMPGVQWTDDDQVTGNTSVNYFYKVTSIRNGQESGASSAYGEFDYQLNTTITTDFNDIALPLFVENLTNAQDLLDFIPGCTSVARWDATLQGYVQYIPGFEASNFNIEIGSPYYVNVEQDQVLTITGKVVSPEFNLITTNSTDFNEIVLPFDKSGLTMASELLADIENCNSVAFWENNIQGYLQYIPGLPFTDFSIQVGYPYYVNVTAQSVWPGRGLGKAVPMVRTAQSVETSQAPHLVWGPLPNNAVSFNAWLEKQPEQVLSEQAAGCAFKNSFWMVQTAAFTSGWKTHDNLIIEFYNASGNVVARAEQTLGNSAYDYVASADAQTLPDSYGMMQNYPNPFNPVTTIQYQVPETAHVRIDVYNTRGQWITTLVDRQRSAGRYSLEWDGTDASGLIVASGTYFYRMQAGQYSKIQKMVFLK